jgi:hypothetical protein
MGLRTFKVEKKVASTTDDFTSNYDGGWMFLLQNVSQSICLRETVLAGPSNFWSCERILPSGRKRSVVTGAEITAEGHPGHGFWGERGIPRREKPVEVDVMRGDVCCGASNTKRESVRGPAGGGFRRKCRPWTEAGEACGGRRHRRRAVWRPVNKGFRTSQTVTEYFSGPDTTGFPECLSNR